MIVKGRTWVFGHNMNTDLMYPSTAFTATDEERRGLVFSANRPGWSDQVQSGDIIVGGSNFGTGSGRPASRSLRELGIVAIVAESMNGLFFRNSINYALPVMECRGITDLVAEGDVIEIDFGTGDVTNVGTGRALRGAPLPGFLMDIVTSGGLLQRLASEGYVDAQ